MMPIKIECGCGQHYAFDVEPANGRMPSPVACPACGADGTSIANEIIAGWLAQPVIAAAASPTTLRVTVSSGPVTPAAVRRNVLPGQVSRTQAETEAKAKALWGDSQEEVTKYLMMQGFSFQEASEVAQAAFKERAAAVRADGIHKIFKGLGLMCVPVAALILFLSIRVVPIKLMAIAVAVGLWGVWLAISGLLMALAPKSEKGDINDK
ncbi:MAG TPA: hypothetical protein VMH30_01920 [Verrucomicrobiae bacterium]|nr:hypothetical protein [Verrucomicrobiae bacterium]